MIRTEDGGKISKWVGSRVLHRKTGVRGMKDFLEKFGEKQVVYISGCFLGGRVDCRV